MRTIFTSMVLAVVAQAQTPPSPYPGTPVGKPSVAPVGVSFPKVGQTTGTPVGYQGPDGKPINTGQRPAGQVIDLTNLAAPLTAPLSPDLAGTKPEGTLEKLYRKWKETIGISKPATTPPSNYYVPGLSRRNRERHKDDEMRRRD